MEAALVGIDETVGKVHPPVLEGGAAAGGRVKFRGAWVLGGLPMLAWDEC